VPRIDVHTHFLPDDYRAALVAVNPALTRLPDCSTEALLSMMERFQIDAAIVSLSPPGVFHGDPGKALDLARTVNDYAAGLRRAHPDRFATLGVIPLPDVAASLDEIRRCRDELDLDGFEVFTNVAGTYLGNPRWDPVLAELDARRAYVFVHPVSPPYPAPLMSFPDWLFEFPFESTRAIVNLIYAGCFERFPNIRFHFAHLGGAAVFLAHRIASLATRNPELAVGAPAGAIRHLQTLYLDTAQADSSIALSAALELSPVDRIVFGTDWPYAALPTDGSDPAPGLAALDAHTRERVLGVSALALVPRLANAARR
jgi:6-methylsalicylate decarboxylase